MPVDLDDVVIEEGLSPFREGDDGFGIGSARQSFRQQEMYDDVAVGDASGGASAGALGSARGYTHGSVPRSIRVKQPNSLSLDEYLEPGSKGKYTGRNPLTEGKDFTVIGESDTIAANP
jgi:hypothetical protein